jgi:predicted TPR repeat methyltransferase
MLNAHRKTLKLSELSQAELGRVNADLAEIDPDKVDVVQRYVHLAPVYNDLVGNWEYQCPWKVARILQNYVSPDQPILDAGCGTGLVGQALSSVGYQNLSGIDISADMLEQAEATGCYRELQVQDLSQPPYAFPDRSFAAIACIGVFFLIADPFPVLQEFCRLVQPQGYLVFTQHDLLFQQHRYAELLSEFERQGKLRCESISAPTVHLPKRNDYDRKVIYCVYQVIDAKE